MLHHRLVRRADLTDEAYRAAMADWESPGPRAELPGLFRVAGLDLMTRVPPWGPYLMAGPMAGLALWWGLADVRTAAAAATRLGAIAYGALAWSLVEYLLHRFVFHARARSETARIAAFLAHGHHHVAPGDRSRIAAPPLQMTSALLLLFALCDIPLDGPAMWAAFGGAVTSYLVYEAVHFVIHHGAPRGRALRALRRHHLAHHHLDARSRWGIASPLWDVVFRTTGATTDPDRRSAAANRPDGGSSSRDV